MEDKIINPGCEIHPNVYRLASKYKSVRRAIRRGHMTINGWDIPKRPFNNRGNNSKRKGITSRVGNEYKKLMYGQIRKTQ